MLSFVLALKNQIYYFYNNMINLKNFEPNSLRIHKMHYKDINIYYIRYITIKKNDGCESIFSMNSLYLLVNHASGYIEEKNGNKHLIFDDSADKNKELRKMCGCLGSN